MKFIDDLISRHVTKDSRTTRSSYGLALPCRCYRCWMSPGSHVCFTPFLSKTLQSDSIWSALLQSWILISFVCIITEPVWTETYARYGLFPGRRSSISGSCIQMRVSLTTVLHYSRSVIITQRSGFLLSRTHRCHSSLFAIIMPIVNGEMWLNDWCNFTTMHGIVENVAGNRHGHGYDDNISPSCRLTGTCCMRIQATR